MPFDDFGAFLYGPRLVVLPHRHQKLGIGPAVAKDIVAARFDLFDELRIIVADAAVQQDRGRQFQLVEHFKQAPVPDPIAVVAPGKVSRRLLAAADRIHP